jgi:hypothetical protein
MGKRRQQTQRKHEATSKQFWASGLASPAPNLLPSLPWSGDGDLCDYDCFLESLSYEARRVQDCRPLSTELLFI